MTSIDYETAAALHPESTNDSHLGEMAWAEKKLIVQYLTWGLPEILVQMFWPSIDTVGFYDFKYCGKPLMETTICIWHIKSKSTLPESVEATGGEKNMGI